MAPSYFLKPETAHAKAKDLINVGKKASALDVLYEMLRCRRARSWQKSLETPMFLFVDLCVELKRNQQFKSIIHQYRNISIQECPQSLDDVLTYYLTLIKTKTEEVHQQSKDIVPDVEDLDILETPESLMLNAVSPQGAQGRSDHTILTPWIKFLWEAYRIVLGLVVNNSRCENLYHRITRQAFAFCVEYRRRTEFRKLCDMVRLHTTRIQNQQSTQNAISLNNPDTAILHFETRLRQLDCAMELEMYNEAFRVVEDIWGLAQLPKQISRPSLMTEYYSKTAELFLRSGYYLFHAAALYKRLNIYREYKRVPSAEELSKLSSEALCAALSVPLPMARTQFSVSSGEFNQAKQKSLASLLGLTTVPTRASLMTDLAMRRVQTNVPPELFTLYSALEVDFQPLKLAQRVLPALDSIAKNPALAAYLEPLRDVVVSKTLLQLAQVYRSLHFNELVLLCPFYDPLTLERSVIELIYNLELPMRVDHRKQAIIFDVYIDLGISQRDYTLSGDLSLFSGQTGGDKISRQLAVFAQSLNQVCELLNINESGSNVRDTLVLEYQGTEAANRQDLLSRYVAIEKRKEQVEAIRREEANLLREEEARIMSEKKARLEQEEATLKEEAEKRVKAHLEEQARRRKMENDREWLNIYMQTIQKSSASGVGPPGAADVAKITEEDLEQFNREEIVARRHAELYKKRTEYLEKANNKAKKLDHLVRACRLKELPLLKAAAVREAQEREEIFEKARLELAEASQREHEDMLKNRERLVRMRPEITVVNKALKTLATARYKEKFSEWEALRTRVRAERLAEREANLEAEKLRAAEEEICSADRRLREEAALAAEEDRRKQEEEAAEARRAEDEKLAAENERVDKRRSEMEEQLKRSEEPPSQVQAWGRRSTVRNPAPPPAAPAVTPSAVATTVAASVSNAGTEAWVRGRKPQPPTSSADAPYRPRVAPVSEARRVEDPRGYRSINDVLVGGNSADPTASAPAPTAWKRRQTQPTTRTEPQSTGSKQNAEAEGWKEARRH